jgi:hypothetical protein
MKTFLWLLKYVLLPLTPLIAGFFIRTVHLGTLSFSSLSPVELCFSMAMISFVISSNAAKLNDAIKRDALTHAFQMGVLIFVIVFALSLYLEIDILFSLKKMMADIQESLKQEQIITKECLPPRIGEFESQMAIFRIAAIVLSFVVIPIAIYSNNKYNLEDL